MDIKNEAQLYMQISLLAGIGVRGGGGGGQLPPPSPSLVRNIN